MRKRLVFAPLCILAVPLLFPSSQKNDPIPLVPFSGVAFAGHTVAGTWCGCGEPGCICDPGELGGFASPVNENNESSDQGFSPIRDSSGSGIDFGSGTLILALALFMWTRLRA